MKKLIVNKKPSLIRIPGHVIYPTGSAMVDEKEAEILLALPAVKAFFKAGWLALEDIDQAEKKAAQKATQAPVIGEKKASGLTVSEMVNLKITEFKAALEEVDSIEFLNELDAVETRVTAKAAIETRMMGLLNDGD